MLLLVLCILAMPCENHSTRSSCRVDDVILEFIVNATPVLFPPSRISLYLCIDYDDTIELSRKMSNNRLTHGIHNSFEKFDRRIHNNLEHRNLYALDLHCDYAIKMLQQAHSERMFVAPAKWMLLQDRRIDDTNLTSTYGILVSDVFEDLAVYPDSDVVLAQRLNDNFIELTSVYRPSSQRGVILENRGNWSLENGLQMRTHDVASARRRNLGQTELKSSIVLTNPDTINHLTDYENKHIDSITRINYIWILHLANRMNATMSFNITNTWGYLDENGSWSGMMGMLQRREIDIGTSMYFLTSRLNVAEYIQLYTRTGTCFVFRRPLLSTVKNIFALPFERNVWIAIAVFILLVVCLLYLSTIWEYNRDSSRKSASYYGQYNSKPTIDDSLLVILGAFAQQGYSYEPYRVVTRVTILMLLLASLSLYAAYTANIVGLLQSTTDSIKTPKDLLHSPLSLGVQDTVYNRHYFKSFQDPVRKAIMQKKIEPKGRKHEWMNLEEGVRRIRTEPFAFHGVRGPIYHLMQETYREEEKCGITEIDYLNLIMPLLVIQKQSPYLEIIKNGALKLREYGLKQRDEYRLYTEKPKCSSKTSFITIGFTECYFALVAMGYGLLLSIIVFALELLWHRNNLFISVERRCGRIREPSICENPVCEMSLFKTKEWWRTRAGVNESFDRRSLLIAPLFGPDKKDVIVIGSHSGYLRIYCPSSQWLDESKEPSGYKSSDLIIETRISECLVDMKTGKFVSGSQDTRLAILTPAKLVVYSIILSQGSVDHGDRCDLEVAYEHPLSRFPTSLTTGPFGGVRGRDFLCVQCLDGALFFYEQETPAFSLVLGNRLLPEPIVYVSRNDVFVTPSSSWVLGCYRYKSMAEFGSNKDRAEGPKHLEPDWSYNIGEAVLDIDAVTLSSFEVGIVVLGEKNLYCLKDNCVSLKYAKRLEYKALCFQAYVIEPDGKLMVLVIADTNTLMIYEGTTLKWSAQLPLAPVAVTRAHFQHLNGVIVVLSEEGQLEACYLGSEPSLFIAPPLHRRGYDYVAAEDELMELRKLAKRSKASGNQLSDINLDAELIVSVTVSPDLEPYPKQNDAKDESTEGRNFVCRIGIELSSYTTLRDVQVCIEVSRPFVVEKDCYIIPNLCNRQMLHTTIHANADLPSMSSDVRITASYETDRGSLRVLQKTAQLPLKMMLRACPPENTSTFTATIKCSEPLVSFSQLFPELTGEIQRQNWNVLGLQHVQTGSVVTIVSGATSNRYRVQSNDGLAMALVVQQLLNRLKDKATGNFTTTIAHNHVQLVQSQMEAHFRSRQEADRIASEIGLLSTQLRNIERKLLRAVRERNTRSLAATGLPFLLESTYRAIFALLDDLAIARAERERTGHGLQCAVRLLLLLLRLNVNDDKYAMLEAAIGFEPQLRDELDWEEIADAGLCTLLRSTSRKSGHLEATKPTALSKMTSVKEFAKLKKRLVHAVERLDSCREVTDLAENEQLEAGERATS
ncbi:protein PTHB1-like [Odontomachus brunneus]|uniref:protein PTHB1-like n=1 Tax=Odontomachus brunneus TaxID=486640 RepID=UPI0013F28E96|nr:protein PTHB1-like [Odontomachus brunneus]